MHEQDFVLVCFGASFYGRSAKFLNLFSWSLRLIHIHKNDKTMNILNVLLDRDGTIIKDKHYLSSPADIEFLPHSLKVLQAMNAAGLNLFLVTNQSGIGRGYFSLRDYHLVHEQLLLLLEANGIRVKDSAFCPHSPDARCSCRKPGPGMWAELSKRHGLDPGVTVIIGDKLSDVLMGHECGLAAAILVGTGKGAQTLRNLGLDLDGKEWIEPKPASKAKSMPSAAAKDLNGAWKWLVHHFG